jgi:hypothetical protein
VVKLNRLSWKDYIVRKIVMKNENRLHFEQIDQDIESGRYYQIFNTKKQYLGEIRRKRVGRFMHWCFCPALDDDMAVGDLWFSNGCLKEIVDFISSLYKQTKGYYNMMRGK